MSPEICSAPWLPITSVAWNAFCASMAGGLLLRTAYDAAHPLVIGEFAEDGRHAAQWLAICSCAITVFALFILALGVPQPGSGGLQVMLEAMPITMSLAAIVLIIRYTIRLVFQRPAPSPQGPDTIPFDDDAILQLGNMTGNLSGRGIPGGGLNWRPNLRPFARANGVAVAIGLIMLLPTLWSLQLPRICR